MADDHPVVRLGLKQILLEHLAPVAVGEAANGSELLERLRAQPWDLLILDLVLPDQSGLDLLPDIKQLTPQVPVLVVTMHTEQQYGLRLLRQGAAGYLTKDRAPEELVAAVQTIVAGGKYISPALAEHIALLLGASSDIMPHERLSDREWQVMRMLASGLSVAEIAADLSLHVRTIGTFRRHILRKLNLKSTAAIIHYAISHGLVDWSETN